MRKDILLALIAVSASGTAIANVDLNDQFDANKWSFTGVPGEGSQIKQLELLVPNLAGGAATQTLKGLPQGKYILTWNTATAKNVVVKVNGKVVESGEGTVLKAEGDITIEISAASNNDFNGGYFIEGIDLQIFCEPGTLKAELQGKIDGYTFEKVADDVPEAQKDALAQEKEGVDEKIKDLQNDVDGLPETDTLTLKEYKDYQLWEDPAPVQLKADEVTKAVDQYNGDVTLANLQAEYVTTANNGAKDAEAALEGLQDKSDLVAEKIETADENQQASWIKERVGEKVQEASVELEKLTTEIQRFAGITECPESESTIEKVEKAINKLNGELKELNDQIYEYGTQLDDLANTIQDAIDTANNYNAIWVADGTEEEPSVNYINGKVDKARKALFKLEGDYAPIQEQANVKINNIVKTVLEGLNIQEGDIAEGTDENKNADVDALKQAIQDIQAQVDNALATLDGPYGKIVDAVNGLVVESLDGTRPSDEPELQAKVDEINTAKNEVLADAKNALATDADGMTDDMYNTQISAIQDLIDNLNAAIAASKADVAAYEANDTLLNDYLDQLNGAWEDWKDQEKKIEEKYRVTPLPTFDNAYKSIKGVIDAQIADNDSIYNDTTDDIPSLDETTPIVSTIKTSIEGFTATGDLIIDAVIQISTEIKNYEELATAVGEALEAKTAYGETAKDEYKTALDTQKIEIKEMGNQLSNAVSSEATSGQQLYEAIVKVSDDWKDNTIKADLDELMLNLEKGITEANIAYIESQLNSEVGRIVESTVEDEPVVPGASNIESIANGLETELGALDVPSVPFNANFDDEEETVAEQKDAFVETYADVDAAVAGVYAYYEKVKEAVEACNTNQENYEANLAEIAQVQNAITKLNDNSEDLDAYEDTYKALISDLQDKLDELSSDNKTTHDSFDVKKNTETEVNEETGEIVSETTTIEIGTPVAAGLNNGIANTSAEVAQKAEDINQNEARFQDLVDLSVKLGIELSQDLDIINAHILAGSVDAPALASALLGITNELYNYNGTIYNAYKAMFEGTEDLTYETVEGKMLDWQTQANGLLADLNSDVIQYNDALFDMAWNQSEAMTEYKNTVLDFNSYKTISNTGFLAFDYNGKTVAKLLDQSQAYLFDKFGEIHNLDADAQALVKKLNGTYDENDENYDKVGQTITDQFDLGTAVVEEEGHVISGFNTRAAEIVDDMTKFLSGFANDINAAAAAYYTQEEARVSDLIGNAEQAMTASGIAVEDQHGEAWEALKVDYLNGVDAYDAVESDEPLAKNIDTICGYFDKVTEETVNTATNQIAWKDWDAYYTEKYNEVNEYKKKLEDCPGVVVTTVGEKIADIKARNAEAEGYYEDVDLLGNLPTLKANLDADVTAAKDAIDAARKAWDDEHANENLYNDFMDNGVPALKDAYNALVEFVMPLGAANKSFDTLDTISNAIDQLIKDVKDEYSDVSTVLGDDYKTAPRYTSILVQIANAYMTAYADEVEFLNANIDSVLAAFNTAMANDKLDDGAQLYNEISKVRDEIKALPANADDQEDAIAKGNAALGYQNQLANWQQELDGCMGGNPAADAVAEVQEALDPVAESLKALQAQLDECYDAVQEEYEAKVQKVDDALQQIQDKLNDPSNEIIYQVENLKVQINDIQGQIDSLATEIAAAQAAEQAHQDKINANQEAYDTLSAQLDAFDDLVDTLESEAEFFGVNKAETIEIFRDWSADHKKTLDADYAGGEGNLDATSEIPGYNAEVVEVNKQRVDVAQTGSAAAYDNATEQKDDANDVVEAYYSKYPTQIGRYESEITDLDEAYKALDEAPKFDNTLGYPTENVDAFVAEATICAEAANGVAAQADDLIAKIAANSLEPGDTTGDGKVSIADLSKILEWVLTQEEFDETNANHNAGDLNGNGRFDMGDVQTIINIINGSSAKAKAALSLAPRQANITAGVERTSVESYAINMANDITLVGGMFDVVLPEGTSLVSITATDRLANLEVMTNDLGNGTTRVVFFSTDKQNIQGNQGAIFTLEVEGNGNAVIDNVEFTNANGHLYEVTVTGETTGIGYLWNEVKTYGQRIYNASGMLMNRMQRGINIVRNSDGTSSKVLKK